MVISLVDIIFGTVLYVDKGRDPLRRIKKPPFQHFSVHHIRTNCNHGSGFERPKKETHPTDTEHLAKWLQTPLFCCKTRFLP
jgi:hypothetical protein